MAAFQDKLAQLQAEIDAAMAELQSPEHQAELDAALAQAKADVGAALVALSDPEREKATLTRLQAKVVEALTALRAEAGGDGE